MPALNQVDNVFAALFESEHHAAYQVMADTLRKTVRNKTVTGGESTQFPKIGTGAASQKTRHGLVPLMNVEHGKVTVLLEDWYAADYHDMLDELKIQHDERKAIADAAAYALARKTMEMITTALNQTTNITGNYSTAFSKALASEGIKELNLRRVPDDRQRFAALTPQSWEHFINISEVKSADFAGNIYPWLKGTEAIMWRGTVWQMVPDLPGEGTSEAKCFIYHKTAAACATGHEPSLSITPNEERHAYFIKGVISQGAAMIDSDGIEAIHVNDTVAVS